MHTMVRRFIKTGILFLFLGLAIGTYALFRRELVGELPNPYLVSAHTHLVFGGFVVFVILGVALWLFPRPAADDQRYWPELVQFSYWILAIGTLSRTGSEALRTFGDLESLRWSIIAGASMQLVGFGVYFWTMWPRIRAVGSALREARGERF